MSNPSELLGGRLGAICLALSLTATLACPSDDGSEDEVGMEEETDAETTETNTDTMDTSDTMAALSHAADIQPIWTAKCTAACHEPGGAVGATLDLSGDAYDNIVDVNSTQVSAASWSRPAMLRRATWSPRSRTRTSPSVAAARRCRRPARPS
ncbi:MAG: hypothetical protein HC927_03035 [Deltaproteobacteria bacterium]|nr:hypothetical protein [Deltaproteobacteria bacterium]